MQTHPSSMPLTLYRRHGKACPYHRKSRSARNNRSCAHRCAVWVQGRLGREYVRRSLDLTSWEAASAVVREWEIAGRIGGPPVARPAVPSTDVRAWGPAPPAPAPSRDIAAGGDAAPHAQVEPAPIVVADGVVVETTALVVSSPTARRVDDSIAKFVASLKAQKLAVETVRKYESLLERRLLRWCATQRVPYELLSQLKVEVLDDFRAGWTDGPLYALKNIERLRAFFRFCVERSWISKNPATAIKPPKVWQRPTLPFTDAEMERILAACDQYRGNRERMRAFVLTMRFSGLRISDTIALHPDQRVGNNLRLYTAKTGHPVFVPLPPHVVAALQAIERPGQRYFSSGNAKVATARANWSRYLDTVFEQAAVNDGHSHRFRDTFSVALLEKGVSVETVAMLLGNTPAIVQKHYAPWIRSRQVALEAAVKTTWALPPDPSQPPSSHAPV